ncbi:MAG: AMP-binding protein, partial [Carboxylicivirga sp.]|nr:AMP-binding protein [Carboxylicivirga sp.]
MSTFINEVKNGILSHKERNAFFINEEHTTYDSLNFIIGGIAEAVIQKTNGLKQCIGIIEGNDIETYASVLAVLMTGNTFVILNPNNPEERNLKIIKATEMKLILSSNEDYPSNYNNHCVVISNQNVRNTEGISNLTLDIPDDQLAYIIFTSGSTGEPKGVPITHKNLDAFYTAYKQIGFKLSCNDRMLQVFDLCFDPSVVSMLHPLTLGACAYTVSQNEVKYTQVYELLEDEELTFAAIPPSLLSYLQPYFDEIKLPSLRYLILTAEASKQQLIEQFRTCIPNAEIFNLYGPTEGTIYCTSYKVPLSDVKHYNGMLAIGKEFYGTTALILDEDKNILKNGQKGELCIAGNQILNAYWHNP